MSISDIPPKVRCLLWAKSAGHCEFNGCNKSVIYDSLTKLEMNFGDVAHIIGDSSRGPRGNIILSKEYCRDVSNLMLMCLEHHRMIDKITKFYSDNDLRRMKKIHEDRMELLTGIDNNKTSNVLIYKSRIGEYQPKIEHQDTWIAMTPEWYPASKPPIELGLVNCSYKDNENNYWIIESENLERQFNEKVKPLMDASGNRNHFSIFAIAPQPLLIKLGALLSDLYPAEVYQLHREPTDWKWQPEPENFRYEITEPQKVYKVIALNLSLSATIQSDRIKYVFGDQDISEWKITIATPNNDFLKGKKQLKDFRIIFRNILDKIKYKHGEDAIINIFPAVPISIAVEMGRVRQPKADLPFVIYDQNKQTRGFTRTLYIGDFNNG